MATKREGEQSYNKADLDEPIFCLRAQDRAAPGAVRDWAERARRMGASHEKCQAAMETAVAMEKWAEAHGSKVPD